MGVLLAIPCLQSGGKAKMGMAETRQRKDKEDNMKKTMKTKEYKQDKVKKTNKTT